jgi:hypothetical protein
LRLAEKAGKVYTDAEIILVFDPICPKSFEDVQILLGDHY